MKIHSRVWLLTVSFCSTLAACDWVDSKGLQSSVPRTEVILDDTPIGSANVINEKTVTSIVTSRDSANTNGYTYRWSDSPLEEGILPTCVGMPGFDAENAATAMRKACSSETECSVGFEAVDDAVDGSNFVFTAPMLKASIGLRYVLKITNAAGSVSTNEYDFCLIAINEAPDANDDTFVVREGVREVFSAPSTHLLSNDTDDVDVTNETLLVNENAVVSPRDAAFFELRSDGSFVYESKANNILSDQFDSFEYALSDGIFTSTARVSLRIVASNQAPELIDDIPNLRATVGVTFVEDFSLYFVDPEQGDLNFSFASGFDLADDSGMSLDTTGVLSGIPLLADVGSHTLKLVTSDGGQEIETLLALTISNVSTNSRNSIPTYVDDSVTNRTMFLGATLAPITPEFFDADDDVLIYSVYGSALLPVGVSIDDETGVISGRPVARIWVRDLRVIATDPSGAVAISEPFFIRVR